MLELRAIDFNYRSHISNERFGCRFHKPGFPGPSGPQEEEISDWSSGTGKAGKKCLVDVDHLVNCVILTHDASLKIRSELRCIMTGLSRIQLFVDCAGHLNSSLILFYDLCDACGLPSISSPSQHGDELIFQTCRTIELMTRGTWREELERAVAAAQTQCALDLAEVLKQTVRRLRQTADESAALSLVVSSSAAFSHKAAAFVLDHQHARMVSARGFGQVDLDPDLHVELKDAAAFFSSIETQDPVIALANESELSADFFTAAITGFPPGELIYLFPLVVHRSVPAIFVAIGEVRASVMELLAEVAAAHITGLPQPAPAAASLSSAQSWEDLTLEERATHLRAQRFARLKVSEMRLYQADAVRFGAERSDLYSALKTEIDAARDAYRKEFPGVLDYLYLELVRNLANNNDRLLGAQFPGPLA